MEEAVFCVPLLVIILWILWHIVKAKFARQAEQSCSTVSTVVVLGSGGHTTEMLRLSRALDKDQFRPIVYVAASTDSFSRDKVFSGPEEDIVVDYVTIPRSREVKQSWITSVWTTSKALWVCLSLLLKLRPRLLLCNGPGTCVPLCLVAWMYNHLGMLDTTIVYVESICRVKTLSLSAHILVYFANEVLVQWPELQQKFPRTKYIARFT